VASSSRCTSFLKSELIKAGGATDAYDEMVSESAFCSTPHAQAHLG
jgi:hypothetical protein